MLATSPLAIGYPGFCLFRTPELTVQRGDRIAIVGPNGAGKSTLLRTLIGELRPLEGSIRYGNNIKPAYLAQEPQLDEERTILDTLLRRHAFSEEEARRFAARFLFEGDEVFKPVGALSGGERRRLALALLALERANLFFLDEPTNHLDLPSREALEAVLADFDGTIVFVSHDRYIIDRLATTVWAIEDGQLTVSLGNYSDYQQTRQRNVPAQPNERATRQPQATPPRRARSPRQIECALIQTERTIEELEARLHQLADELDEATARQDVEAVAELGAAYERLQEEIERAYAQWERLQDELAAVQVGSEP
ncbi:putative ABC transporter ATP-binding protein YbiT [bacterium HR27]|nr:putative ABC transporter ATP-binding protein YbiT [bacterium HR27]